MEQIPELGSPDLRYRYVCVCVLSLHIPPNCLIFRQERYEDRQLYYKPFCAFPTIPLFYYYCYSGAFTQSDQPHFKTHTQGQYAYRRRVIFKGRSSSCEHTRQAKRQDGGRLHCLRQAINTDPVREHLSLSKHTHTHHLQRFKHTHIESENHQSLFRPCEKFSNGNMSHTVS